MGGSRNRNKGHNLERIIAQFFRGLGYKHCKTTRNGSKLLDDCGVDIMFVPFLIQCKAGYENSRPKYDKEFENTMEKLSKHFPEGHENFSKPYILIHKLDGAGKTKPHRFLWTFDDNTIRKILTENHLYKQKYGEILAGNEGLSE